MQKIYSVMIKGRVLESWDLRELLARAVSAKREPGPKFNFHASLGGQTPVENPSAVRVAATFPAMYY